MDNNDCEIYYLPPKKDVEFGSDEWLAKFLVELAQIGQPTEAERRREKRFTIWEVASLIGFLIGAILIVIFCAITRNCDYASFNEYNALEKNFIYRRYIC